MYVCNLCDDGFEIIEDVKKHIVNYHQNGFLQLCMEFNTDEEKDVDDFMKEFDKDENKIFSK